MAEDLEIICAAGCRLGWLRPGEIMRKDEYDLALFHLNSVKVEFPDASTSQWSITVAERLQWWMDAPGQVRWLGDSLESMPTARSIIDAGPIPQLSTEQLQKLIAFYKGEQWDPEVLGIRRGRPSLVVNVLPRLVSLALDANTAAGLSPMSDAELDRLWVILTIRNMDAQRMYNYMVSAVAEITAAMAQKFTVRSIDAD